MEFFKKNVLLTIVLAVAFILASGLLYMVFTEHSAMTKQMAQVEKIRLEIENLIKQSPAPVAENLEMIKADTEELKQKLKNVQGIFGKPYKVALQKFAQEFGVTEEQLNAEFREFWANEARPGTNRYQLIIKFKKQLDRSKFSKAISLFAKQIQLQTVEPVDDSNIDDYLLVALGLPRTMSNVNCKTYMLSVMQPALSDNLIKANVLHDKVAKFSFGEFETRMPLSDNIPVILRHGMMLDDLLKRIMSSKIEQIDAINKLNGLNGELSKDYLKFRYSLTVMGTQGSLRAFVNSLQNAYKDNRVYIIKDISLEKVIDGVKEITDTGARPVQRATPGLASRRTQEEKTAIEEAEKDKPYWLKSGYGLPVIGESSLCKLVIEFEYVIYVGDELKLR